MGVTSRDDCNACDGWLAQGTCRNGACECDQCVFLGEDCDRGFTQTPTAIPTPTPKPITATCGEVKEAYKHNHCCGNPHKMMKMDSRRLTSVVSTQGGMSDPSLVAEIKAALQRKKERSGEAAAMKLAQKIKAISNNYAS